MMAAHGTAALIQVTAASVGSIPPLAVWREPTAMSAYSAKTPNETPTAPRAASFAYLRTDIGESDAVMVGLVLRRARMGSRRPT